MNEDRAKLLVVDDDDAIRGLIASSLASSYEMTTCEDARSAISLARQTQPDAVILDMALGDTDGGALFRQLRSDPATAHIPVIFCTVLRGAAMGPLLLEDDTFAVYKPFAVGSLRSTVERALGR
jgi:CheY-like chemotaxis protein